MRASVFNFFIVFFAFLTLSACANFGGVVGNSNRAYVSDYNYPALRIVPYDDPHFENKASYRSTVKVCTGKPDSTGFKCQ